MADVTKLVPAITPEMAPFFDAAKSGRLLVEKCESCGMLRFPHRAMCSRCLSEKAVWAQMSGRGEVYSFIVMHQVYHPGFANEVPYAVVVVKLEEGVKITSNLIGMPSADIRCGMPVETVFDKLTDEVTLPKFRLRKP